MSSTTRDIVIYGAGGMGRETAELIIAVNADKATWNLLGFVDDDEDLSGTAVAGLPVLASSKWLERGRAAVALALGCPQTRQQALSLVRRWGRDCPVLIHPQAIIGRRVQIEAGSVIAAGAILTTDISVGTSVIVNVGATVSHDVVLNDFTTIAPGAHLAGAVIVHEGADIGVGASVIPGKVIGPWARVGAGAVVIRDVPAGATVVGCPARVLEVKGHVHA